MLQHFHFAEALPQKGAPPHEPLGFEDALELPSVEDVDSPPSSWGPENSELAALELLGASVLDRAYSCEESAPHGVSCKGASQEDHRL